jgi:hypothetical protein
VILSRKRARVIFIISRRDTLGGGLECRAGRRSTWSAFAVEHGMAEAFMKILKRDYVRVSPIPNAAAALALVDS